MMTKSYKPKVWTLFFATFFAVCGRAQTVRNTSFRIGMDVTTQYNYKMMHNALAMTLSYKNSSFFIGPEHTCFFNHYYSHGLHYERNTFGVCFGYNYSFFTKENHAVFVRTAFSVFPSIYSYYQMGLADWVRHKDWVIQNTVSLGVRYRLDKHLLLSLNAGFGSLKGFFLLLDSFIPMLSLSLGYN